MGVDMSVPREILGADPKAPVTGRTHVTMSMFVWMCQCLQVMQLLMMPGLYAYHTYSILKILKLVLYCVLLRHAPPAIDRKYDVLNSVEWLCHNPRNFASECPFKFQASLIVDSLVLSCPRSSTLRPNGRNLPPAKQAVIARGDTANRRQDLDSKEVSQMSHSKLKLNM